MQDALDKAILWLLMDKPRTLWEMAEQVMKESGKTLTDHEKQKWCNKARYRLSAMVDRGFVARNKKTRKYSLENVIIGEGTMTITCEDGRTETMELGKTIIAQEDDILEVILMEEVI